MKELKSYTGDSENTQTLAKEGSCFTPRTGGYKGGQGFLVVAGNMGERYSRGI